MASTTGTIDMNVSIDTRLSSLPTLSEAMAIAVLKGDVVAAYALADMLLEQRAKAENKLDKVLEQSRNSRPRPVVGHEVYHWPEFRAFCSRAGIHWDLNTISMSINMSVEESLEIVQVYRGGDTYNIEVTDNGPDGGSVVQG